MLFKLVNWIADVSSLSHECDIFSAYYWLNINTFWVTITINLIVITLTADIHVSDGDVRDRKL